jgi:hypothetical protein
MPATHFASHYWLHRTSEVWGCATQRIIEHFSRSPLAIQRQFLLPRIGQNVSLLEPAAAAKKWISSSARKVNHAGS